MSFFDEDELKKIMHKILTEEPKIPKVEIVDGELLIYPDGERNPYPIDVRRIKKPIQLIWWIHHLSGKGWFDNQMCKKVIEVVCTKIMNIKMYQGQG